ncbi:unnamed protein product [Adineta steineri]|uniref:RRM domain-containing protein n=1 Tax=Adineta steineri TaxID=433720 RepID=A0A814B2S4_9BILA|nr:unnamed protein product [Adineta steineri]CAF4060127.1 unnamed protein product [Adineta steineri]
MAAAIETKLYVTNFPSSATRQQLQQFFSRFGRVQECAIMWNSYAFVHYATMDEARRALDQSNGAMFLNRKLIVQLSTSRFRPQPKELNTSLNQLPEQLMIMDTSSSIPYHHTNLNQQQQQSTSLIPQYTYPELLMTSAGFRQQSSSPISDNHNFFRPTSPITQDINNYYSQYSNISPDQIPSLPLKINPIKPNKTIKTDMGNNGELPKLYCTNLPDNCKANELQRLFSSFGHVVDCVILWDYYAFITYKTFVEAEHALIAVNGFTWKDRRLIVEWSRASGRKQQQPSPSISSSSPPKHNSYGTEISTPTSSPRNRPSTLLTHSSTSNGQFYENNSSKLLPSPLKSHHTYNQNLALMSIMQQQQQPFLHNQHHASMPYNTYKNGNNMDVLSNENQQIFDNLTNSSSSSSSSSNHRLDLSPFIDTNPNTIFSSSSELNTPSSTTSNSNVYQPSDIIALLEPSLPDVSMNNKSMNDITNTFNHVPPTCSSAAAAGVAALFQENILSSLFTSFEPFNKLYSNDEQQSSSRYNHFSPLLTTAPDNSHYPMSCGHNNSWR